MCSLFLSLSRSASVIWARLSCVRSLLLSLSLCLSASDILARHVRLPAVSPASVCGLFASGLRDRFGKFASGTSFLLVGEFGLWRFCVDLLASSPTDCATAMAWSASVSLSVRVPPVGVASLVGVVLPCAMEVEAAGHSWAPAGSLSAGARPGRATAFATAHALVATSGEFAASRAFFANPRQTIWTDF